MPLKLSLLIAYNLDNFQLFVLKFSTLRKAVSWLGQVITLLKGLHQKPCYWYLQLSSAASHFASASCFSPCSVSVKGKAAFYICIRSYLMWYNWGKQLDGFIAQSCRLVGERMELRFEVWGNWVKRSELQAMDKKYWVLAERGGRLKEDLGPNTTKWKERRERLAVEKI